ncbi:MAG: helix-turn-helix domain-containing protein [Bacteroidetes bacterium]|nr:helix-turn-helix domain-containing protein [Bacteroidota bacterium]
MEKQSIVLYSIPIDELITMIRENVRLELQNYKPAVSEEEELIDSKEACKILGISLVTLHFWRIDGKVKYYRISTRIRFKRKELMEALETCWRYKR